MSLEQFALLVALVVQTGTFVWWAATLTAIVKQHGRDLEKHDEKIEDHNDRLREGKL